MMYVEAEIELPNGVFVEITTDRENKPIKVSYLFEDTKDGRHWEEENSYDEENIFPVIKDIKNKFPDIVKIEYLIVKKDTNRFLTDSDDRVAITEYSFETDKYIVLLRKNVLMDEIYDYIEKLFSKTFKLCEVN